MVPKNTDSTAIRETRASSKTGHTTESGGEYCAGRWGCHQNEERESKNHSDEKKPSVYSSFDDHRNYDSPLGYTELSIFIEHLGGLWMFNSWSRRFWVTLQQMTITNIKLFSTFISRSRRTPRQHILVRAVVKDSSKHDATVYYCSWKECAPHSDKTKTFLERVLQLTSGIMKLS